MACLGGRFCLCEGTPRSAPVVRLLPGAYCLAPRPGWETEGCPSLKNGSSVWKPHSVHPSVSPRLFRNSSALKHCVRGRTRQGHCASTPNVLLINTLEEHVNIQKIRTVLKYGMGNWVISNPCTEFSSPRTMVRHVSLCFIKKNLGRARVSGGVRA